MHRHPGIHNIAWSRAAHLDLKCLFNVGVAFHWPSETDNDLR